MRLKEKYEKKVQAQLMEKLGLKNKMSVPKIDKVCCNVGFGSAIAGKASNERKKIENHIAEYMSLITGQKPVLRKAKQSIASFKLREGINIGALTTLRGKRMYEFIEKLIYVVIPRQRDFRGIPEKSIDQQGNLTLGFKEYSPFPEVKQEREKGLFGFEITFKTTAKDKKQALELFKLMGFPIKENG